jgi:hypothetical protein
VNVEIIQLEQVQKYFEGEISLVRVGESHETERHLMVRIRDVLQVGLGFSDYP